MNLAPCHICGSIRTSKRGMKGHMARVHKAGSWGEYWNLHLAPPCSYCGVKIPYRKDGQHQARKYCSLSCAGIATAYHGPEHVNWKGGTWTSQGYVMRGLKSFTEPEQAIIRPMYYPNKTTNDYRGVGEHRALVAIAIGRPLTKDEQVHHINGIRHDNRLENLELVIAGHGAGFSSNVSMCCPRCDHRDIARNFVSGIPV